MIRHQNLLVTSFLLLLLTNVLADVRYVRKTAFVCQNCPTQSPNALEFHPEEHIGILVTLAVIIVLYLAIIFCTCYPMIKNMCSNKNRNNQPASTSSNARSSRGSITTTATLVDAESA